MAGGHCADDYESGKWEIFSYLAATLKSLVQVQDQPLQAEQQQSSALHRKAKRNHLSWLRWQKHTSWQSQTVTATIHSTHSVLMQDHKQFRSSLHYEKPEYRPSNSLWLSRTFNYMMKKFSTSCCKRGEIR